VTSRAASVEPHPYRAFEHTGWQNAAARYGGSFAHATGAYAEALLNAAGAAPGMRLLDVACGPGLVAAAAVARGCAVEGVDFSAAMLGLARARVPKGVFHEADAEALPLPDASFDAVVSNFGLHHFPFPARALAEIRRVLRPGGTFAATVWAAPELNRAFQIVLDAIAAHGDPTIPLPTPPQGRLNRAEDCVRLLVAAGWRADAVTSWVVHAGWRMAAADLVEGFAAGTVRMAGLIAAQSPAARLKIRVEVAEAVRDYRHGVGYVVPTAAVLVSGVAD
jgi:SAM-dependent methyltransferase